MTLALSGSSWTVDSAVTDLPEPLSPTSATVSPCADLERDAAHRLGRRAVLAEGDVEVAHLEDGFAHANVFRGSKASRTPSKMKTSSDSMIAKVKKAVKASHGACRFCLACSVSSPSDGAEDGRPKPRKSSEASVPIVAGHDEGQHGHGRHHRVRQHVAEHDRPVFDTPSALAARTYSKLRARRNSARTTPTSAGQPNSTVRNTSSQKLRPRIAKMMMMM